MMSLFTIPNLGGAHLGGWRHPEAYASSVMNLQQAIEVAQLAERGKLDGLFLADGNGVRDMDKPTLFAANFPSARPGVFDPVVLMTALATHTSRIGLVSTATTTFDEPWFVARRFASLDHVSGGRAGWNLVTASNPGDAMNFNHAEPVGRDERYGRAEEFIEVVRGLWDSWADDAFVQDKASGQFLDPSRVRALNHAGAHFRVAGPLKRAAHAARPPGGVHGRPIRPRQAVGGPIRGTRCSARATPRNPVRPTTPTSRGAWWRSGATRARSNSSPASASSPGVPPPRRTTSTAS